MLKTRNIIAFNIDSSKADAGTLQSALAEHALVEPGALELERIGFVPPIKGQDDVFVRQVGQFSAFSVGIKKKMIPGSVVNDRVEAKCAEIAAKEDRKVGGKERKRVRDDILADMLRQAFIKTSRINAWIDHKIGRIYIDASSRNNAELVLTTVRKAVGSFPATPITAGQAVSVPSLFYEWLREEGAPEPLSLGDECVLSIDDGASTWAGKGVNLCGAEVSEHLDAGSVPKRLGLVLGDRVSFLLDDELIVRKLKLMDGVFDDMGDPADDAMGAFDAGFALMAGEVARQFECLTEVFQIPAMDEA